MSSVAATFKFSMDVCLYMSQNFDFITLPAHLTTGSSIMHTRKTGCFELIRGKCNKIQALPYEITLITIIFQVATTGLTIAERRIISSNSKPESLSRHRYFLHQRHQSEEQYT
jgi:hypothetical protein